MKKSTKRKLLKSSIWLMVIGFVMINLVAIFHSYTFTHFSTDKITKTESPDKLTFFKKLKTVLLGVNNPRPINKKIPFGYTTFQLQSNKKIECWQYLQPDSSKGTIAIFHGYCGEKSSMLDKAKEFENLNYNILLVDFMGCGGSEGNQTTVGFKEAEEVKTAFDYLIKRKEKTIYLFGTSMGAVAIMKAINDYQIKPNGIIIECPFGSMYQTTCARFKTMNVPVFPMAGLLVFWGGIQNGFWAMGHQPIEYAKTINCPTLLLYGEKDLNVSRNEIDNIYTNIQGPKTLKTFPLAGHENYLTHYKPEWQQYIYEFLNTK
jgi:alpha-beta hydrolase superfamily lysophospholipase